MDKYYEPLQVDDGDRDMHRDMSGVWNAVHPIEAVESRPLWNLNHMEIENAFQNYHRFMHDWIAKNTCKWCTDYTAGRICRCEFPND